MIVTIKKYANRRLYDTSESRYITQEELAEKIRGGVEPRVVDAKTGEDLTQTTLVQLVLERGAGRMMPVPLLVQLVRMDEASLAEFLGYTTGWALQVFFQTRAAGNAPAQQPFGMYAPYGAVPPATSTTTPWGTTLSQPRHPPAPAPVPPAQAACPPLAAGELEPTAQNARGERGDVAVQQAPPSSEVDALRREMEVLKQVILSLARPDGR